MVKEDGCSHHIGVTQAVVSQHVASVLQNSESLQLSPRGKNAGETRHPLQLVGRQGFIETWSPAAKIQVVKVAVVQNQSTGCNP